MQGAIIGDMVGSVYDEVNIKTKQFNVFNPLNKMTDDSLLTIEVAKALLSAHPLNYDQASLYKLQRDLIRRFTRTCRANPRAGWGYYFYNWAHLPAHEQKPYGSYANGGAMRVSPVGWVAKSIDEVKILSKAVTEITHNDHEALKGAEAIAVSVFLAKNGTSKADIAAYIYYNYYPELLILDYETLRNTYTFTTKASESVPYAIFCFLKSTNFKDALQTAVSIGGDSDTIAAMTGAIAEAYYTRIKPSKFIAKFAYLFFDTNLETLIKKFKRTFN